MKVIIALVLVVVATEAVRLRFRPSSKADPGSSPAWCKGLDCPTFKVLESTAVRLILIYEPPHGKTNNLHMRKQRRRSSSR